MSALTNLVTHSIKPRQRLDLRTTVVAALFAAQFPRRPLVGSSVNRASRFARLRVVHEGRFYFLARWSSGPARRSARPPRRSFGPTGGPFGTTGGSFGATPGWFFIGRLSRFLVARRLVLLRPAVRAEIGGFVKELRTTVQTDFGGFVKELRAAAGAEVGGFIGELRATVGAKPLFVCWLYGIRIVCRLGSAICLSGHLETLPFPATR